MSQLDQRYGTDRPARRQLIRVAVVALAIVALGWLGWVIAFHGRPLAESELVTFEVTGEHTAEATMSVVRRDVDVEASCLLRAQASDHSIVGELNFTVGPESPATALVTQEVRTEREATSLTLVGCRADGQGRRR